jgi:hypothetical protein
MGLDAVEICLRTEELFAIHLEDAETAVVRTVGDFYILICSKLNVTPLLSPITPEELPVITQKGAKIWHRLQTDAASGSARPLAMVFSNRVERAHCNTRRAARS